MAVGITRREPRPDRYRSTKGNDKSRQTPARSIAVSLAGAGEDWGTLDLGDLMETVDPREPLPPTSPVSEEAAIHAGIDPGRVIEACSLCEALMDVTDQPPWSQFRCPNCGQRLRVHRQFNNYRLLEFLGEGGMGWVYKAVDRTGALPTTLPRRK